MSKEQKQQYLRDQILGNNYDPTQFVVFLNTKLPIGDDIDKCSFQELKAVVDQFISTKQPPAQPISQSQPLPKPQPIPKSQPTYKPKQILFNTFNLLEPQFAKNFPCRKIVDKYTHLKSIKCVVSDPQRKNTGGIFGLVGSVSFLQFKVQTLELNWKVGRRYSDFVWLRNYLLSAYPSYILPPIPQKKASKKTQRHIFKRMRILQFFLNDLVSIRQIFNDKYVQGFLNINDNLTFSKLKKQAQSLQKFNNLTQCQNFQGTVLSALTQQNKVFMEELEKKVPQYQSLYKQITRRGKKLQQLFTQQVNTLYQMGNMFADLHQHCSQTLNKLPKCQGLSVLNDIYITLNNMVIEWGNIKRNEHQYLQKNFNTFFKYLRHQLYGYTQLISKIQLLSSDYFKARQTLQKKKQKIYNLHDSSKWQLPSKDQKSLTKQIIHDKIQATKVMLPLQTSQVQKLKTNLFFFLNELYSNSQIKNKRICDLFCQNFKQFTINVKVNNQQLGQMWNQMSSNFSTPKKKNKILKSAPLTKNSQDVFEDD